MKTHTVSASLLLLSLLFVVPFRATAADACQPVNDALTKVITTPHHVYMSETAAYIPDGGKRHSELVSASNGKIYVQMQGKWRVSPETPAEQLQQHRENLAQGKTSCQPAGEESLNGEAAAIYKIHSQNEDAQIDGRIWISKGKGLPLRQEIDMDTGGSPGKSHREMRYDYANVSPPSM